MFERGHGTCLVESLGPMGSKGVEILPYKYVMINSVNHGGCVPLRYLEKPKPGHKKRLTTKITQSVKSKINSKFRISEQ